MARSDPRKTSTRDTEAKVGGIGKL